MDNLCQNYIPVSVLWFKPRANSVNTIVSKRFEFWQCALPKDHNPGCITPIQFEWDHLHKELH